VEGGPAAEIAPTPSPSPSELLGMMSPEDRVGQLFLVAFLGSDFGPDSDVAGLIREGRLGGVVLQASSRNILNASGGGPAKVAADVRALQEVALGPGGNGIPLFVAVDHEGDGEPLTHLRFGYTPVPSAMAIGATWSPSRARDVGSVVGRELAASGVNMLLGPVLDVLAEPRSSQRGDLGVRAFGGDPYWVGLLGRAYIRGVQEGGAGRVLVIAKHFPGHGASDRLPDTEVATISRSLSELRRVEIPPFEAVARGAPGTTPGVADGLMTSHIRYRGFQGNLRDTTPPISLDRTALAAVFALPDSPLGAWRAAGGLVVADSLGVRAVRRYDDPSGLTFRHRDIARQALEAGNDLLIISQFATINEWRLQRANILDTVRYLALEYRRDARLASRIDEAALKVLTRKSALYDGEWTSAALGGAAPAADTASASEPADVVAAAVREAVGVIRGPEAGSPRPGDAIVVVTDDEGSLRCEDGSCPEAWLQPGGSVEQPSMVEAAIREKFARAGAGPDALARVSALEYCQLARALTPPELAAGPEPLEPECSPPDRAEAVALLRGADWIVFAITELNPVVVGHADSVAGFLQLAGETVKGGSTRLAALSFGPPYVFEPTDFHKLDTFVASYTKIPVAVDAAVDALLDVAPARGAPPVSVEAADYDLASRLEPDPDHAPSLVVGPQKVGPTTRVTVRVANVLDRNGNAVPDGTVVNVAAVPSSSAAGIGGTEYRATTTSGAASFQLAFRQSGGYRLEPSAGTVTWSAAGADLEVMVEAAATARAPNTLAATAPPAAGVTRDRLSTADLALALASVVVVAAAWVGAPGWSVRTASDQVTILLAAAAGALLAYVGYGVLAAVGRGEVGPPMASAAVALVGAVSMSGVAARRRRRELSPAADPVREPPTSPRRRTGERAPPPP
jgi:beta-N-acetylhexosaminidase